jgi:hypothetical protein
MPAGLLAEDGPRPDLAETFGAVDLLTPDYRLRTEQNVRDADATLWFGSTDTPGARTTLRAAETMGKPRMVLEPGSGVRPSQVAAWLARRRVATLKVAGNRESRAPGIGERVERFPVAVFVGLGQATHAEKPLA